MRVPLTAAAGGARTGGIAGATGPYVSDCGRSVASSASMNGHRCIQRPLILPGSISTT
jgi:hypothetical protein